MMIGILGWGLNTNLGIEIDAMKKMRNFNE